ncbi:hypothetical protein PI126_g22304 [Phytophthora idaei]|nr:hypothetical protein PI126_g22304 [Phytophthora idaei]
MDCLAEVKQRFLFSEATHPEGKPTKLLFRRVSTKFQDNFIPTLSPIPGSSERPVHAKADILADAWTQILQQKPPIAAAVEEMRNWVGDDEVGRLAKEPVIADITEGEVFAALMAGEEDKESGLYRLGNG